MVGRFDVVRAELLRNAIQARRHVAEVLRIGHEDIDVFAAPMLVTQHQDRTAAERPKRFSDAALDFVNERERVLEQAFPDARDEPGLSHVQTRRGDRSSAAHRARFFQIRFGGTRSLRAASSTARTTI